MSMSDEILEQQNGNPNSSPGYEFKWNLENLQITTKSVEKILEPLLIQVFFLKMFHFCIHVHSASLEIKPSLPMFSSIFHIG